MQEKSQIVEIAVYARFSESVFSCKNVRPKQFFTSMKYPPEKEGIDYLSTFYDDLLAESIRKKNNFYAMNFECELLSGCVTNNLADFPMNVSLENDPRRQKKPGINCPTFYCGPGWIARQR